MLRNPLSRFFIWVADLQVAPKAVHSDMNGLRGGSLYLVWGGGHPLCVCVCVDIITTGVH